MVLSCCTISECQESVPELHCVENPVQPFAHTDALCGVPTPSYMSRLRTLPALQAFVLFTCSLHAQEAEATRPGKRALLPRDREIALARSAAPSEVSSAATIYVLTDTGYVVAETGTNGNSCLVDRSWPSSIEPICFDAEASATIMQRTLVQMADIQRGRPAAEIDRELAQHLSSGRLRIPRRPAMAYMMSSAQQLVSDSGAPAGRWQPHLMFYTPYLTNEDLGLGSRPSLAAAMVVSSGKPMANVLIVVKHFVDPVETRSTRP